MKDLYENPLNSRYASREMSAVFSDDNRFKLWRRLWIALAGASGASLLLMAVRRRRHAK